MEDLKLSRSDLLDALNEMNIVIPPDTKLKQDRLRHRLGKALDAAQRYSHLFGNEPTLINPADYPAWDIKKDVAEALYRRVWGGLLGEGERKRGAFAKVCLLIVALGEGWKQNVGTAVFTDEKSTAIAVKVSFHYRLLYLFTRYFRTVGLFYSRRKRKTTCSRGRLCLSFRYKKNKLEGDDEAFFADGDEIQQFQNIKGGTSDVVVSFNAK
jgi:hypothetical protein